MKKTADQIVQMLADWSNKYPRGKIYHPSKMSMDDELIEIEKLAKEYATQPALDGEKLSEEEIKALKREYNLETYGVISDYDRKKLWNWMLSKLNTQPKPVEAVEVK